MKFINQQYFDTFVHKRLGMNLSMTGLKYFQLKDGSPDGKGSGLILYSHPGSDVTGMVARSEKVAGTCQEVTAKYQSYLIGDNFCS